MSTANTNNNNGGAYPLSSLYVGDLHPDINESQLHEKFQTAGPVISLRICRDMVTRRSLGYAYVNYESVIDAERAIDTMNFDVMRGKPIRIMWSHRDPSLRKSGVGNIFIKNLDKSIDTKAMYDTFSAFGAILSCKVAQDETGQSRGYGFVHFEAEESALRAIEKINGMLLNDKQVFVGKFISNRERSKEMGDKSKNFNNIYIKNLPDSVNDEKLKEMFEKFGVITSAKVMYEDDECTKSRGFGFVAFENSESAVQAVEEMNNKMMESRTLYVNRAQKKNERQHELNRKFEMIKQERVNKFQGINLYVKNLDDTIDDERLKQEFSAFGKITSAKVMMEDGHSKGFGFVCFSTPEESAKAVTDMYGKIVGSKPLYVALAQRKEERKHHLESQYTQRMTTMRMQQQMTAGGLYPPNNPAAAAAAAGYFMPQMGPPARFFNPAATPMGHMRPQGRWPGSNSGLGGVGGGPAGVAQGAPMRTMNPGVNQVPGMAGGLNQVTFAPGNQYAPAGVLQNSYRHSNVPQRSMSSRVNQNGPSPNVVNASVPTVPMGASVVNGTGGAGRPITGSMGQQQRSMQISSATVPQGAGRVAGATTNAAAPTYTKFNPSVRNGPVAGAAAGGSGTISGQQLVGHNQEAVLVQDQEPLTLSMLAAANIDEQKQMLGERLFPIIQGIYPELCGKITGMLLEIDNTELIHMLEHRESLKNKVDEAVAVLQAASQKSQHLAAAKN